MVMIYLRSAVLAEVCDLMSACHSDFWHHDFVKSDNSMLHCTLTVQVDENLMPFVHRGPLDTPPIAGYAAPDGDFQDTTKVFNKWTAWPDCVFLAAWNLLIVETSGTPCYLKYTETTTFLLVHLIGPFEGLVTRGHLKVKLWFPIGQMPFLSTNRQC